jgi:hypothetical protein
MIIAIAMWSIDGCDEGVTLEFCDILDTLEK